MVTTATRHPALGVVPPPQSCLATTQWALGWLGEGVDTTPRTHIPYAKAPGLWARGFGVGEVYKGVLGVNGQWSPGIPLAYLTPATNMPPARHQMVPHGGLLGWGLHQANGMPWGFSGDGSG